MLLSHSIEIAQTNYEVSCKVLHSRTHEKSYSPVPAYFHAFVSVLSNVSPSAANCDKRRWTCNLHAAWRFWSNAQTSQGGREQCSCREDYEVEMRNCIENFRPVWQRTVRSETTQDKAQSLSPCQLPNLSESVKKKICRFKNLRIRVVMQAWIKELR